MRPNFRTPALLATLCSALFAAACGGPNDTTLCYTNSDCTGGTVCFDGICQSGNGNAGGSGGGNAGANGGGSGGGSSSPAALGGACSVRSDCASPLSCIPSSVGFPGGYCSDSCGSSSCPNNSACVDLSNTSLGGQACLESCSGNSCRSGYVCCAGFGNVCTPTGMCTNSGGGSGGGSAGGSAGGSGGGSAGGSAGGSGGGSAGGSAGGSGGGSAGGSGGGSAGGSGGGSGGGSAGGSGGGSAGGSGGGAGGGSGGGSGTCSQHTWASDVGNAFSNECGGCHGWASSQSTVKGSISSIKSRINSGSMPQGGWNNSSDKTLILNWITCGEP